MAKQKLIILVNLKVKYMVKDFKNRVCTHTYVGRENLSFFFSLQKCIYLITAKFTEERMLGNVFLTLE